MSFHEDLDRAETEPAATERSFGLVMAGACAVIGVLPLVAGHAPRWAALALGAVFVGAAMTRPGLLAPLNRAWMALGRILNRIVSPVVMGLLFTVVVVPTGIFLRLSGKDPLRLKLDAGAATYWQRRDPPGPAPGSLKQQY